MLCTQLRALPIYRPLRDGECSGSIPPGCVMLHLELLDTRDSGTAVVRALSPCVGQPVIWPVIEFWQCQSGTAGMLCFWTFACLHYSVDHCGNIQPA